MTFSALQEVAEATEDGIEDGQVVAHRSIAEVRIDDGVDEVCSIVGQWSRTRLCQRCGYQRCGVAVATSRRAPGGHATVSGDHGDDGHRS